MKRVLGVLLVVAVVFSMIVAGCGSSSTPVPASSKAAPASASQPAEKPKAVSPEERRAQWIEGAKSEGALTWWGITQPAEATQIVAEFNKAYPFVKVEYWRGNAGDIASKLDAELMAGRISADVVLGGETLNYPRWAQMGLIEKYTEIVPGLEKWHKLSYDPEGYWAMAGGQVSVGQYNTNLVSAAEAPKNWEDVLDPKWKGQIGVATDQGIDPWFTMALAPGGWGLEKTLDFLRKVAVQKPLFSKSPSESHALLVAGNVKILLNGFLRHVLQSQKKGAPVDWVRNQPVIFSGPSLILMKKGPHPNSARLFLEWALSPEGLKAYEDATSMGSPFPGTGTIQSKLVEGLPFLSRDLDVLQKTRELKLEEKALEALGAM